MILLLLHKKHTRALYVKSILNTSLAAKANPKQLVADLQRVGWMLAKALKRLASSYLINNQITCLACLSGRVFTFELTRQYGVANHENYQGNNFTSLSFGDSRHGFFSAYCLVGK